MSNEELKARDKRIPKPSDWECYLFGGGPMGMVWNPTENEVPNWFWRKMQFLFFGNRWKKNKYTVKKEY